MFNYFYIYKNKLINNIEEIKRRNPSSKICAMVKANAYGVGQKQVVKILNDYVDFFGVSNYEEAKAVKKFTTKNILIVSALERRKKLDLSFSYACHSLSDVEYLATFNAPIKIHLKINSGMNRFGFSSLQEFVKALKRIKTSKLVFEGIFTHFATTDEYVNTQMKRFDNFVDLTKSYGFSPIVHADNSFVNLIQNHNLDMVRVGFSLYNYNQENFLPVAEICSTVLQINEIGAWEVVGYDKRFISKIPMRVAVLSIGYADGFDMRLIGFSLNVKGVICRVLNICMDCIMVDASNLELKKGELVAILNNINSLNKYAKFLNTTEYEVMTKFSNIRAKRIIKN